MHFLPHPPPHPIDYKSFEIYWTFFFFRSWNSLKISTQYVSQWPPGLQQTSWIDFPGLYKDGGRMTMESQALTWLKLSSPSVPVHSVTGSTRVYQRQISTISFQACYSPICSAWMEDWEQVLAPVMGIVVVLLLSGKKIQFYGRPGEFCTCWLSSIITLNLLLAYRILFKFCLCFLKIQVFFHQIISEYSDQNIRIFE